MYSTIVCKICGKPLKRDYPAQKHHERCKGEAERKRVRKYRSKAIER